MKKNNKHNAPEIKCIWMLAGIVNYRLCNRNFECETCEFDRAMRSMTSGTNHISENELAEKLDTAEFSFPQQIEYADHLAEQYLFALLSDCQISLARSYHASHLWTKLEGSDVVQIGIDRLITKIMEPLSQLILPEIGQRYQSHQLIGWMVRQERPYPLYTPVGGSVIEINSDLNSKPVDILSNYDTWLFKIRNKNIQEKLKQQCNTMQSLQNYVRKIGIIRKHLHQGLQTDIPKNVNLTLADGGQIEIRVEKVIGRERFKLLTDDLFLNK